jgi:hypothetical protein
MKLLIQDDFFKNIDAIRKLALSFDYESSENLSNVGWKGYRTKKLETYNHDFLNECSQKILNAVSQFYNLSNYFISTYFHISYEDTKKQLFDFEVNKYHKDFEKYAGVVYLTPDPITEMGTSILDGYNNQIVNVENVYNRLVSYPAHFPHAPSNLFGNTKENGRMTLTFFINDTEDKYF